jgi:hypothetical protein
MGRSIPKNTRRKSKVIKKKSKDFVTSQRKFKKSSEHKYLKNRPIIIGLTGKKLFSLDFMNEFREATRDNEKKLRIITKGEMETNQKLQKKFTNYLKLKAENNDYIAPNISSDMCDGLYYYFTDTIKNKSREILDHIVLIDELGTPCGILVAQKGECKEYRDLWSVRIICNLSKNECKNGGSMLLGCYMYMLKRIGQKIGLLELAHSFSNYGGFCMYSKFGFYPVPNMKCEEFTSGNLPMISILDNITVSDIINVSMGRKNRDIVVKSPICEVDIRNDKDLQKKYIEFLKRYFNVHQSKKIYDDIDIKTSFQKYNNTNYREEYNKSLIIPSIVSPLPIPIRKKPLTFLQRLSSFFFGELDSSASKTHTIYFNSKPCRSKPRRSKPRRSKPRRS